MEYNKIYNEDCFQTMKTKIDNDSIDVILTSPPYNNSKTNKKSRSLKVWDSRYDIYNDNKSDDEYIEWSINLFNEFNRILKKDGTILYNISYSTKNPYF